MIKWGIRIVTVAVVAMGALGAASAFGGGGPLQLYLVNS